MKEISSAEKVFSSSLLGTRIVVYSSQSVTSQQSVTVTALGTGSSDGSICAIWRDYWTQSVVRSFTPRAGHVVTQRYQNTLLSFGVMHFLQKLNVICVVDGDDDIGAETE